MPKKAPEDLSLHNRVRDTLKTMDIDQSSLAQQLGVTQTMVSMALRGTNQKTFLRLLALLKNEYQLDFDEKMSESKNTEELMQELKKVQEELGRVLERLEKLEERINTIKK